MDFDFDAWFARLERGLNNLMALRAAAPSPAVDTADGIVGPVQVSCDRTELVPVPAAHHGSSSPTNTTPVTSEVDHGVVPIVSSDLTAPALTKCSAKCFRRDTNLPRYVFHPAATSRPPDALDCTGGVFPLRQPLLPDPIPKPPWLQPGHEPVCVYLSCELQKPTGAIHTTSIHMQEFARRSELNLSLSSPAPSFLMADQLDGGTVAKYLNSDAVCTSFLCMITQKTSTRVSYLTRYCGDQQHFLEGAREVSLILLRQPWPSEKLTCLDYTNLAAQERSLATPGVKKIATSLTAMDSIQLHFIVFSGDSEWWSNCWFPGCTYEAYNSITLGLPDEDNHSYVLCWDPGGSTLFSFLALYRRENSDKGRGVLILVVHHLNWDSSFAFRDYLCFNRLKKPCAESDDTILSGLIGRYNHPEAQHFNDSVPGYVQQYIFALFQWEIAWQPKVKGECFDIGVHYCHGNIFEGCPSSYMPMVMLLYGNYSHMNSWAWYTVLVGCLWQKDHLVTVSLGGTFNVFSASNLDKQPVSLAGHLKTVSSLVYFPQSKPRTMLSTSYEGIIIRCIQGVGYGGRLIRKNNTQIKCFVAPEEELITSGRKLMQQGLQHNLHQAQQQMERQADKKRTPRTFSVGDAVELQQRFPSSTAWGQAVPQGGGDVSAPNNPAATDGDVGLIHRNRRPKRTGPNPNTARHRQALLKHASWEKSSIRKDQKMAAAATPFLPPRL